MHEGFIAEILANPHDDAPRLVYADWLEEQGDPRAVLLRVAPAACRAADLCTDIRPEYREYAGAATKGCVLPLPQVVARLPSSYRWGRYGRVGRLLSVAALRDVFGRVQRLGRTARWGPVSAVFPWRRLWELLVRYELQACYLVGVKFRDDLNISRFDRWTPRADHATLVAWLVRQLPATVTGISILTGGVASPVLTDLFGHARAGRFGRFLACMTACRALYRDEVEVLPSPAGGPARTAYLASRHVAMLEVAAALQPWDAIKPWLAARRREAAHAWANGGRDAWHQTCPRRLRHLRARLGDFQARQGRSARQLTIPMRDLRRWYDQVDHISLDGTPPDRDAVPRMIFGIPVQVGDVFRIE